MNILQYRIYRIENREGRVVFVRTLFLYGSVGVTAEYYKPNKRKIRQYFNIDNFIWEIIPKKFKLKDFQ